MMMLCVISIMQTAMLFRSIITATQKPYVTYTYNADNELTEKVNTDTGLKYVYGENGQVSVYKTADNSLVQSYTEQETEADEENGVEGSKTVNEIHFEPRILLL